MTVVAVSNPQERLPSVAEFVRVDNPWLWVIIGFGLLLLFKRR